MAFGWFSILVGSLALAVSVQGQPGFISIDCGIAAESSGFNDSTTDITYQSDAKFIDTGESKDLPETNLTNIYTRVENNLRIFPHGNRNCYNLSDITKGNKYLIRVYFRYGNYDGKNKAPEFDLYIGVNLWMTVSNFDLFTEFFPEIITVATMNFISVCLVNKGLGTPFISALELRPLKNSMYGAANESQSLLRTFRSDVGGFTGDLGIRYPRDPFDLIWRNREEETWSSFNTSDEVMNPDEAFHPPSMVMMTAIRPVDDSNELNYSWPAVDPSFQFHVYMYFAELEQLDSNMTREFTVCCGNDSCFDGPIISPKYLVTRTLSTDQPLSGQNEYSCSFRKTPSSTLPPILNAIEVFAILQHNSTPTSDQDGGAPNVEQFGFKKKIGDTIDVNGYPCVQCKKDHIPGESSAQK